MTTNNTNIINKSLGDNFFISLLRKLEDKGLIPVPDNIEKFYAEIPASHLLFIDHFINDNYDSSKYIITDKYISDSDESIYIIYIAESRNSVLEIKLNISLKVEQFQYYFD